MRNARCRRADADGIVRRETGGMQLNFLLAKDWRGYHLVSADGVCSLRTKVQIWAISHQFFFSHKALPELEEHAI